MNLGINHGLWRHSVFPHGDSVEECGGGGSFARDLEGKYIRENWDLENSVIVDSSKDSTEGSIKGNSGAWRLRKR
jgi:hypothetical protein